MAAIAPALAAGAASAGEWTGTITEIDEVARNIVVRSEAMPERDRVFALFGNTAVGPTIDDLKEGDKVSILFADSDTESGMPVNATTIDKVGEGSSCQSLIAAPCQSELRCVWQSPTRAI
jgi:hypothetical protein